MEITAFKGQKRDELSMIEVAHAILEQHGEVMEFSDLVNQIQNYLGKSDIEIRENLSQFYTDLNIDGSFISLGENRWGLRSWYAIDEIDEEVTHVDEEEDTPRRKKRKRVNAFINDPNDENAIDYNDDDPEDDDFGDDSDDDLSYDDDDDDDDDEEIVAYDNDLKEIVVDEVEEDVDVDEEDDEFADDDEDDDEFEESSK
ncbi:MAG: DNA-directed RNA polymerase subunit delta [Lactobacillales bacterium]|nr:DNA-directed RNA polymerase subunit delta [Lactobacillales bacterium]